MCGGGWVGGCGGGDQSGAGAAWLSGGKRGRQPALDSTTKKQPPRSNPAVQRTMRAASPVRAPSLMPEADSTKAVRGGVPRHAPTAKAKGSACAGRAVGAGKMGREGVQASDTGSAAAAAAVATTLPLLRRCRCCRLNSLALLVKLIH